MGIKIKGSERSHTKSEADVCLLASLSHHGRVGKGGVIAILVLGVGYRKQCEEKAVQCLSRLNIGLGAGTGRLRRRWGGKLSSAVALAAAAPHIPCPGRIAPPDPAQEPWQHHWAPPVAHIPFWGCFLLTSNYQLSRRSPQSSPCIGQDAARPEVSPGSHKSRGRRFVLSLRRTISAAQHLSKAHLALGQAPQHKLSFSCQLPLCPVLLTLCCRSLGS